MIGSRGEKAEQRGDGRGVGRGKGQACVCGWVGKACSFFFFPNSHVVMIVVPSRVGVCAVGEKRRLSCAVMPFILFAQFKPARRWWGGGAGECTP